MNGDPVIDSSDDKQTEEYKELFTASIVESFGIACAIGGLVCHIAAEAGNETVKLETVISMAILNAVDGIFTRTALGLSKSPVGDGAAHFGKPSLCV